MSNALFTADGLLRIMPSGSGCRNGGKDTPSGPQSQDLERVVRPGVSRLAEMRGSVCWRTDYQEFPCADLSVGVNATQRELDRSSAAYENRSTKIDGGMPSRIP